MRFIIIFLFSFSLQAKGLSLKEIKSFNKVTLKKISKSKKPGKVIHQYRRVIKNKLKSITSKNFSKYVTSNLLLEQLVEFTSMLPQRVSKKNCLNSKNSIIVGYSPMEEATKESTPLAAMFTLKVLSSICNDPSILNFKRIQ